MVCVNGGDASPQPCIARQTAAQVAVASKTMDVIVDTLALDAQAGKQA